MQRAPKHANSASFKWRVAASMALSALLASPSDARHTPPIASTALATPVLSATPALWSVQHGATTLYLFGTFHTLNPRTAWFNGAIRTAFNRSDELVLETVVPDDPREISAIAARHVTTGPLTVRGAAHGIAATRVGQSFACWIGWQPVPPAASRTCLHAPPSLQALSPTEHHPWRRRGGPTLV